MAADLGISPKNQKKESLIRAVWAFGLGEDTPVRSPLERAPGGAEPRSLAGGEAAEGGVAKPRRPRPKAEGGVILVGEAIFLDLGTLSPICYVSQQSW